MKCNRKGHLMICNDDDLSVVEWDPQTSQILDSVKLDSIVHSIALDNEDNQWIVCNDDTVRKRQREDQEFIVQFTLDRSDMIYRIAVTKQGKLVIRNCGENQIEIWELVIRSPAEKWFRNRKTTKKWKQTRRVSSSFRSNFRDLEQIKVDSRDRIIICDRGNNRVVVLTDELKDVIDLSTRFKFDRPWGLAVDEMDNIFVAERNTQRLVVFDCEGNHLNTFHHSLDHVFYVEVMGDSIYVKNNVEMEELKIR